MEGSAKIVIEGNLIDVIQRDIYPCSITISDGHICTVEKNSHKYDHYIMPGFVDAHIHIESSMLLPSAFADAVIPKGTVAVLNDPHEIANVIGMSGVLSMVEDSRKRALKCYFGIPSCVPATPFDHAGSTISVQDTESLAKTGKFLALSEMMNVPGVLSRDPEVMEKLEIAKRYHLRIDGHAPGLRGESLADYIAQGVETDHESATLEEAEEKISLGMKILIREGSAAKNFEALKSLIALYPTQVMFCTDDAHPDDILKYGHIDYLVRRAVAEGFDLFDILQVACVNPVRFYGMNVGLIQPGDPADFIMVDSIEKLNVLSTYIDGEEVYSVKKGLCLRAAPEKTMPVNIFNHRLLDPEELYTAVENEITVIRIIPDELLTEKMSYRIGSIPFEADVKSDVLKLVYINRYNHGKPQIGFISGIGIRKGAFASCISHDSHNILAVGTNDSELCEAINAIISQQGGLAVKNGDRLLNLPLPVAGIVSIAPAEEVATAYLALNREIKEMGSSLNAPFMTLSFMALIVIPALKIGEHGLFDVEKFEFIR